LSHILLRVAVSGQVIAGLATACLAASPVAETAVPVAAVPVAKAATPAAEVPIPRGEIVHGEIGAELDLLLTRLSRTGFSGAVLVADDGVILLKKGYGPANRETKIANQSETLFEVGSLAKIFTAAAILRLEADGKLRLDDPVARYIGPLPGNRSTATLHHLLVHTSGLVSDEDSLTYHSRETFLRSVREAEGEGVPGATFRYSNAGYTLLAVIVEQVSGEPFEDYLRKGLFQPAGMRFTGPAWEARPGPAGVATGYEGLAVEHLSSVAPTADVWGHRGPGGLITNVGDLYRWILALETGTVLSGPSVEKMLSAHVAREGYGWHVVDESNLGRLVRRGGSLPGFESSVRWYRDADLVIIFTVNSNMGFRIKVARGIARTLAPHLEAR
jgi:CubicO group peptidase (beta-lactamase class C family)